MDDFVMWLFGLFLIVVGIFTFFLIGSFSWMLVDCMRDAQSRWC